MLWKQIADHKHASKFMNPVTDEIANKYSTVIKGEVFTIQRGPRIRVVRVGVNREWYKF